MPRVLGKGKFLGFGLAVDGTCGMETDRRQRERAGLVAAGMGEFDIDCDVQYVVAKAASWNVCCSSMDADSRQSTLVFSHINPTKLSNHQTHQEQRSVDAKGNRNRRSVEGVSHPGTGTTSFGVTLLSAPPIAAGVYPVQRTSVPA